MERGALPTAWLVLALVSPGTPPSTHTAGLGPDTSFRLCVEPQNRGASSWKSLLQGSRAPGSVLASGAPRPSSALSLPCSMPLGKPFTHRQPQAPHQYDQGRPPHPKAPLSAGSCWDILEGRHRKEWQLSVPQLLRAFGRGLQHGFRDWACE